MEIAKTAGRGDLHPPPDRWLDLQELDFELVNR